MAEQPTRQDISYVGITWVLIIDIMFVGSHLFADCIVYLNIHICYIKTHDCTSKHPVLVSSFRIREYIYAHDHYSLANVTGIRGHRAELEYDDKLPVTAIRLMHCLYVLANMSRGSIRTRGSRDNKQTTQPWKPRVSSQSCRSKHSKKKKKKQNFR